MRQAPERAPEVAPDVLQDDGDREMTAAVRDHGAVLSRRALWLTRDPSQAADLCQETWERALRGAHRQRETVVSLRWLLTIMHNAFLDERRAEAVRRVVPNSGAVLEQMHSAPDEVPLWRSVTDELLQACLERLSPAGRQIFELQRSGLSYGEIAARTGVHVSTVGTRLLRVRRRLRGWLAAKGICEQ